MPKIVNISKEELYQLYKIEQKTTKEIALLYNCNRSTIGEKLKLFGIKNNFRYEINKEELKEMYLDKDMTSYEIADIFGCHRKHIIRRLKKMGIKVRRHKRKYSVFYEQKLTEEQKEIIYGGMLGDGHMGFHHEGENGCRYMETHGEKQLEYLKWKMEKLDNFISRKKVVKSDNTFSKTFGKTPTYNFITVLHKEFTVIRKMFYTKEGKKIVPLFKLTPLSLAIWIFDDGSCCGKNKYYKLYTLDFDDKSLNNLLIMLKRDLNIEGKLVQKSWKWKDEIHKGKAIEFNRENSIKIYELIKNFKIPSVEYKIDNFITP